MKYLFGLLLFCLVSCQIPQDLTPAPINHNKMTLEMQSCDKQEVGLLGCFYNEKLEGTLTVPLWNKGEYIIQSDRCAFSSNKTFIGTQKLTLSYQELLKNKPDSEDSCLFNVKVFLDKFDNGFEGFFLLSKGDMKALSFDFISQSYSGYAGLQLKEGSETESEFAIKASQPGLVFWEGCSQKGEKKFNKDPLIKISDVIFGPLITSQSCVLTVGLIPDDNSLSVEMGKIHINIYEKTVVSLPEPVLSYKNSKLSVTADSVVAGIGIDDLISIEHGKSTKKLSTDVKQDQEVMVRLLTSNGRFMLLKVKNGVVLWIK